MVDEVPTTPKLLQRMLDPLKHPVELLNVPYVTIANLAGPVVNVLQLIGHLLLRPSSALHMQLRPVKPRRPIQSLKSVHLPWKVHLAQNPRPWLRRLVRNDITPVSFVEMLQ